MVDNISCKVIIQRYCLPLRNRKFHFDLTVWTFTSLVGNHWLCYKMRLYSLKKTTRRLQSCGLVSWCAPQIQGQAALHNTPCRYRRLALKGKARQWSLSIGAMLPAACVTMLPCGIRMTAFVQTNGDDRASKARRLILQTSSALWGSQHWKRQRLTQSMPILKRWNATSACFII